VYGITIGSQRLSRKRNASLKASQVSLGIVPVAALAAAWLLIAAWRYRGLFMDDAYIGFRYIANLLAGRGFVFDPAARVEGVTDAGWLLFLAPFAAVLGPPLAAKAASLVLLAATLALTVAAAAPAGRLGPPFSSVPMLALTTTAFHAELTAFALLGMETALLAALLMAMLVLAEHRRLRWLPLLGTLAFLVHPEAGLVVPLGAALAWSSGALSGRAAARTAGACVFGLAAVTLARWAYFGALLPNTFTAKPTGVTTLLENLGGLALGSAVNVGFPFAGLFALPFMAGGWWVLRRAAPLVSCFAAAASIAGLAFAVYARPDWTELGRYFAPYAPAAFLLLWTGILAGGREALAGNRAIRAASAIVAILTALTAAAAASLLGWRTFEVGPYLWVGLVLIWLVLIEAARALGRLGSAGIVAAVLAVLIAADGALTALGWTTARARLDFPGYVLTSRSLVAPALWMRDHLPAGTTIATRRIGALAYFSGHPVFDYSFGLTEPAVARLIRRHRGAFISPADPELAAAWRKRAPDYILEDRDVLYGIAAAQGGTPRDFRVHGLEYRMVRRFPIGRGMDWVLAERRSPRQH
jgi:hypothetical protein